MTVEIKAVEVGTESIIIEAIDLEKIIMAEDLFADIAEEPTVKFEFSRKAKNGAEMKYLYRVCQGQNKCKSEIAMGAKLQKLPGCITQISDGFRIAQ